MTIAESLHILGLRVPTSHAEVKQAFRAKAKSFHPDLIKNKNIDVAWANQQFIECKKAYDVLLRYSEFEINVYRDKPIAPKRDKRYPSAHRPVRKPEPVVKHPFVKEADNVAALFQGLPASLKNPIRSFVQWKAWYEPYGIFTSIIDRFSKKQKTWQAGLGKKSFALFRAFRYAANSLMLVLTLLLTSIVGMAILIPLIPAFLLFWGFYEIAQVPALWFVPKKKQKASAENSVFYLVLRTVPYACLLLFMVNSIVQLEQKYLIGTFLMFMALFSAMMLLSVTKEWVDFWKGKNLRVS